MRLCHAKHTTLCTHLDLAAVCVCVWICCGAYSFGGHMRASIRTLILPPFPKHATRTVILLE